MAGRSTKKYKHVLCHKMDISNTHEADPVAFAETVEDADPVLVAEELEVEEAIAM